MSFKRPDLPVEADTTLDGAGTYTGEWVDSSSILSARIAFALYGSGSVGIEESVDGVNPLGFADLPLSPMSSLSNNSVFNPAARYFRVKVTGGSANATLRVSVRRIA